MTVRHTPGDEASGDPHAPLAALQTQLAATMRTAAALDDLPEELSYTDADTLLDATVALDRAITQAQAVRARMLRTVATREAYTARGYVTSASWWRDATRRDHATATRHLRTATRLGDLPELAAALDTGAVTLTHCDAVTKACVPGRRDAIVAAEHTLTTLARTATPREVRIACRRIAELVDPDGTPDPTTGTDPANGEPDPVGNGQDPSGAPDPTSTTGGDPPDADTPDPTGLTGQRPGVNGDPERGLWLHRAYQGRWRLVGDLDPVVGERLAGLLDALDEPDPPGTDPAQLRSAAQRRHDAFARLVAAAETLPDLPTRHGARPRILVTIDLLTLLGHDLCTSRRPRLASGTELAVDAAVELLQEASVTFVLQLGPWRTVALGRTHRRLPPALRPLLAAANRHCRGPGCDRPINWTQAAHLDPWQPGGRTDLDTTLPLCGPHHRLLDHHHWHVAYNPDTADVTWTRPDHHYTHTTNPPDP